MSNRKQYEPLPGFVVKALAELLEDNGGIRSFSGKVSQKLGLTLDKSSAEIFGKRGDPIRRKLQQKVNYWKASYVEKGTYEELVLKPLGVQSHETRMTLHYNSIKQADKTPIKTAPKPSSPSSSESSYTSESSFSVPSQKFEKLAVSKKNLFKSPPANQILLDKNNSIPITPLTPAIPSSYNSSNMSQTLPKNATLLEVEFGFPERTFPILVFQVDEIPGFDSKTLYKGFTILTQIDPRWVYDDGSRDFFTARIWSNDSVLVGIPSFYYDMCHWPEKFKSECGIGTVKAIDFARHKFLKGDVTRQTKYFLLKFPTPVDSQRGKLELSTKEIYDNEDGDETELELRWPVVDAKHAEHKNKDKKAIEIRHQYASWTVVRLDSEPNKRGKPDMGPKKSKAQLARDRQEMEELEQALGGGEPEPDHMDSGCY